MPELYKLLLVGGGHAHVMTLRRWEKRGRAAAPTSLSSSPPPPPPPPLQQQPRRLALVSESATSCYSGMLPGVIAGVYSPEQALIQLEPLCAAAGFELVVAKVEGVSLERKEVEVKVDGGAGSLGVFGFETLSLDIGSTASGPFEEGISKRLIAAKPVHSLLQRLQPLFEACDAAAEASSSSSSSSSSDSSSSPSRSPRAADAAPLPSVVVVGGGAAGVEIAAAIAARMRRAAGAGLVSLVAGPRGLLPEESRAAAALVSRELLRAGVRVQNGKVVSTLASVFPEEEEEGKGKDGGTTTTGACGIVEVEVDGDGDDASPSSSSSSLLLLPVDFVVWCTGSAPHPWLRERTDLELDDEGFVKVDQSLRCRSRPLALSSGNDDSSAAPAPPPLVFAAGDCASISFSSDSQSPSPPKSGVYAVRAGEQVLFPNLRAATAESGENLLPPAALWSPSRQGRPALSLLSLSNGRAVALWPWRWVPAVAGGWVWLLKDLIDRRFIDRESEGRFFFL